MKAAPRAGLEPASSWVTSQALYQLSYLGDVLHVSKRCGLVRHNAVPS